jgi:hypothetical protein
MSQMWYIVICGQSSICQPQNKRRRTITLMLLSLLMTTVFSWSKHVTILAMNEWCGHRDIYLYMGNDMTRWITSFIKDIEKPHWCYSVVFVLWVIPRTKYSIICVRRLSITLRFIATCPLWFSTFLWWMNGTVSITRDIWTIAHSRDEESMWGFVLAEHVKQQSYWPWIWDKCS